MLIVTACTPGGDLEQMVAATVARCRQLGYRHTMFPLEASEDLAGRLPPCTFKPRVVQESLRLSREGELFAWLDADAVLVESLEGLRGMEFDVAVTLREREMIGASRPETNFLNAGVIFFRNTAPARTFIARWKVATEALGNDQWALSEMVNQRTGWTVEDWKRSYGTAFVMQPEGVRVLILEAKEWNCWHFRPAPAGAKILHFKGDLRRRFDWRKVLASVRGV